MWIAHSTPVPLGTGQGHDTMFYVPQWWWGLLTRIAAWEIRGLTGEMAPFTEWLLSKVRKQ